VVFGVALVVALVAWRATDGEDEEAPVVSETTLRIVSAGGLGDVAAEAGHPVYWAGPMLGMVLAVSEDPEGNIQIRYLDDEAQLEEEGSEFLAVGSYPLPDPAAATANIAAGGGAIVKPGPGGVKLVASRENPNSVYFASPDNSVQVEVYDPSPARAMALARSGRVVPAD
jgi:hypothetical protein